MKNQRKENSSCFCCLFVFINLYLILLTWNVTAEGNGFHFHHLPCIAEEEIKYLFRRPTPTRSLVDCAKSCKATCLGFIYKENQIKKECATRNHIMTTRLSLQGQNCPKPTSEFKLFIKYHGLKVKSCNGALVAGAKPRKVVTLATDRDVVCDTTTDGGGWIVIQRRSSSAVSFDGTMANYRFGFGNASGDFWFGLVKIHKLTSARRYELRIDFADRNGNQYYANYNTFSVKGRLNDFKLQVAGYQGNGSDVLGECYGIPFSTKDRDNAQQCANKNKGGWWYKDVQDCDRFNPFVFFVTSFEMKIRPETP